jgi:hypothetical protein
MGMWGEKKLQLYLKKKFFLSAVNRRKIGGMWGWGGNRLNYEKKCKLKCEKNVIGKLKINY